MTADSELRIELIERSADIPLSAADWNDLVTRSATNTVFQTYQWFDAWWQVFGAGHELFFLIVRSDEQILGFAPLMIRKLPSGARRLEFAGTGNADYQDFVLTASHDAAVAAICVFLRVHAHRWNRARLCNLPAGSANAQILRAAASAAGLYVVDEISVPCPALRLTGHEAAARQLIDRYSLRRRLSWFAKRGEVVFRHVRTIGEIQSLLPAFFDQHVRRWSMAGGKSLFSHQEQRQFYCRLATAMHASGWLLFSVVEFNGRPIAFHFGFDYSQCVVWYKPSFDMTYAEHSPGLVLIRQLIEDSLDRQRAEIDFTIGDESFKERFANTARRNAYVGLYYDRSTYLLAVAERRVRGVAGAVLRQVRRVTRTARRARDDSQ